MDFFLRIKVDVPGNECHGWDVTGLGTVRAAHEQANKENCIMQGVIYPFHPFI